MREPTRPSAGEHFAFPCAQGLTRVSITGDGTGTGAGRGDGTLVVRKTWRRRTVTGGRQEERFALEMAGIGFCHISASEVNDDLVINLFYRDAGGTQRVFEVRGQGNHPQCVRLALRLRARLAERLRDEVLAPTSDSLPPSARFDGGTTILGVHVGRIGALVGWVLLGVACPLFFPWALYLLFSGYCVRVDPEGLTITQCFAERVRFGDLAKVEQTAVGRSQAVRFLLTTSQGRQKSLVVSGAGAFRLAAQFRVRGLLSS
jgi:hypothetical protein